MGGVGGGGGFRGGIRGGGGGVQRRDKGWGGGEFRGGIRGWGRDVVKSRRPTNTFSITNPKGVGV